MKAMPQNFYEEEEAEAILRIASKRVALGNVSRDELLASAAELGIPAEAVLEAESAYRNQRVEVGLRREYDQYAKREFLSSIGSWFFVNCGLVALNVFTDHQVSWALWPVCVWGFFVLMDIPETFLRGSTEYEKHYQKWLRRRAKKEAKESALPVGEPGA
jgi:hypothetical protein